jgi:uncharacterized membrane protein YfcA
MQEGASAADRRAHHVTSLVLLAVVFITSTISGVFGMAGGLILMGALAFTLPVSAAMVTHGAVQLVSNGWRAVVHAKHVRWPIIGLYGAGSVGAAALLALLAYSPTKGWVYLMLGLAPVLVWLPKTIVRLDAAKPTHALACGLCVTGLNVAAGVAGPLLDIFFVRTELTRHQIVATKAATQTLAHLAKIAFYGAPLLSAPSAGLPPLWFFVCATPLAMAGAVVGGRILDRMKDTDFRTWTRWVVSGIGAVYLVEAVRLFFG